MENTATRVLLVEDEESSARAVARWLKFNCSAIVVVAPTGTRGLSELAARRFDLVIADEALPDLTLSGIDVLVAARTTQPRACRALLTGTFTRDLVHRAGLVDAVYLNKPAPENLLRDVIAKAERRRVELMALAQYIDRKADEWKLSPRQRSVLHWLVNLGTRDDYCAQFGIAPSTFDSHVKNLRAKLPGNNAIETVIHRLLLDIIIAACVLEVVE